MHRLGMVGLLCLGLLGVAHAQPAATTALTPAQIAARARGSVVLLRFGGGFGSGFVVGKDGRIATNLHVLGRGGALTVVLADGRQLDDVEVLATDETHDLALLRVHATGLVPLPLADSDRAEAGDHVVAIGHPLGLENTVSDGLVSAVRQVDEQLKVLQISAPISPGSSGGPLFNDRGEVIGISTAVASAGQNLNFAIPINSLRPLLAAQKGTPIARWKRPGAAADAGPQRQVPHHDLRLLDGCKIDQMRDIVAHIGAAIDEGAPLYNEGHHQACFRIYESTAREIDRQISGCGGPRRALMDGVQRADGLGDYTAKAWAMRDAFDGVLELVDRAERVSAAKPATATKPAARAPR